MFDELLKSLKRFEGGRTVTLPVQIKTDSGGYLDRECPAEPCKFGFKILEVDWRDRVRDEEAFCPFCRHSAPAKSWFTTEQVEHQKKVALAYVENMIGDALRRDAQSFNQRFSRGGFITMTMRAEGRPREIVLPLSASEPMRLKIECEQCKCRYSVIGSAYFCPACGHSSVERVFEQSLQTIKSSLEAVTAIRASIEDQDVAENTVRLLTENGLQQAVMAFQRLAEVLFSSVPNAPTFRRNAFQNLTEGNSLWRALVGSGYESHLSNDELRTLERYFQQRHLLAHRDGLVDEGYIAQSGDSTYATGQRIVVREHDVRSCVSIIEKLGTGLRTAKRS